MKFTAAVAMLAGLAAAAPTPTEQLDSRTLQKRATITDAADIGYASTNGGTTGGRGGTVTTVSTLPQLSAAAALKDPAVIVVSGTISGSAKVRVAANKSVIGKKGAALNGVGLQIYKTNNVIVRNLKISKVEAANGDGITIQASKNVWVDHVEVSSDLAADKDFYDGGIDVNHGSEWVTISNSYLHDHHKVSLVGHSDSNASEDKGHLHVTYANNYWSNLGSRLPSVRFGTVHIYNNFYSNIQVSGINTRMGAQVLVQSTAFENGGAKAITTLDSDEVGYAVVEDVALNGATNNAPKGTISASSIPYKFTLLGSSKVKAAVVGSAGATLSL